MPRQGICAADLVLPHSRYQGPFSRIVSPSQCRRCLTNSRFAPAPTDQHPLCISSLKDASFSIGECTVNTTRNVLNAQYTGPSVSWGRRPLDLQIKARKVDLQFQAYFAPQNFPRTASSSQLSNDRPPCSSVKSQDRLEHFLRYDYSHRVPKYRWDTVQCNRKSVFEQITLIPPVLINDSSDCAK